MKLLTLGFDEAGLIFICTGGLRRVHTRGGPKPGYEDAGAVTAIVDVYRMSGSDIAEHWNVMQPMPTNATNELGMF